MDKSRQTHLDHGQIMARFPPSCAQATSAVYVSKATFSIYRTTVILLSGPKHGRYGRLAEMAGPGTIASHRPGLLVVILLIPTIYSRYERSGKVVVIFILH